MFELVGCTAGVREYIQYIHKKVHQSDWAFIFASPDYMTIV